MTCPEFTHNERQGRFLLLLPSQANPTPSPKWKGAWCSHSECDTGPVQRGIYNGREGLTLSPGIFLLNHHVFVHTIFFYGQELCAGHHAHHVSLRRWDVRLKGQCLP